MEFYDCLKGRRSIRLFLPRTVDRETLEKIVSAASFSPSWKNSQTVRYVAVMSRAKREEIAENCVMGYARNSQIINGCPCLVALVTVTGRSGYERDGSFSTSKEDRWEVFDAGIAAQSFCLSSYAEGLGTVVLGIFDEDQAARALGLEEGFKVAALIALGYPDENPAAPQRKTTEQLLSFVGDE